MRKYLLQSLTSISYELPFAHVDHFETDLHDDLYGVHYGLLRAEGDWLRYRDYHLAGGEYHDCRGIQLCDGDHGARGHP